MSLIILVEALGALLYFAQKVFISYGKRVGWLIGFLGSIAFTIVTIKRASYAYAVLEITSGITFLCGLFLWKYERARRGVTFLMSGVVLVGIATVFFLNLGSPDWILENTMVALFAVGAVLLVLRKPLGWVLYLLGQLVLIWYAAVLGTYFILALQVASLPFTIIGYRNFARSRVDSGSAG